MKRPNLPLLIAGLLLLGAWWPAAGQTMTPAASAAEGTEAPVGTGFTYQGLLTQSGVPATGAWDFELALFDAAAGGVQVGSTVTVGDLAVAAGVFSTTLDFGPGAFGVGARWLEIRVRPGASGGAYTTLAPRQALTPAPIALSMPNVYTDEATNFVGVGRNFRISGNEVFGVRYTGAANQYGGMYVETSDAAGWPFYGFATNGSFRAWTYYDGTTGDWSLYNAGIRLTVPNEGGLRIGPSLDYSLVIENTTGSDGIRILDTGDDAIQIGSPPDVANYGVYIPSPGVSTYGIWSNTSNAAGEWAFYSVDNIQAGNVFAAGQVQIARVEGEQVLNPGDVVAAIGVGAGAPGTHDFLPTVTAAAGPDRLGVIGVVRSRMALLPRPTKEGADAYALESVPGPAQPGDFVALTVRGVTFARSDDSAPIAAGQRLTAAEREGAVRALRTRSLEGMEVSESTPVIGVALGAADEDSGLVPVYVMLP
ncbi:MAG: hypothetical protein F9K18_09735 [Thermoanaerobaculia bacterium]|nr:MAG: hypothetical protein F9K18_09735 [Thermoanaerobaculia bacterium]